MDGKITPEQIEMIHQENIRVIQLVDRIDYEINLMAPSHASIDGLDMNKILQGILSIKGLIAEYDSITRGEDNGAGAKRGFIKDDTREG